MKLRSTSRPRFPAARLLVLTAALLLVTRAPAQPWLDALDDALVVAPTNGAFRVDFSGTVDLEGYYADSPPPGLLFSDDRFFFNPRLSLFIDAHWGRHLYTFVQARVDRGFDPGADPDGDARFDEYLLRYTPWEDNRLHAQFGKFATIIGNWVPRHHSWDNPFINAPLPYENVVVITDQAVPASPAAFLARRAVPDRKADWLPLAWGPAYTSGGALFGSLGEWDYAAEFKNASISSRPSAWDARHVGWSAPTVSGRLGWRPDAAWQLGLSAGGGSYLLPEAERSAGFPAGQDRRDFNQFTLGSDVSYAWRHWQWWAEVFASRYEVPNVGNADTLAYYVETKYKFTPQLFGAVRWNQQFFGRVSDGAGGREHWDNDAWRIDAALGWRFTRHLQTKLQYSYSHQLGSSQQGEQLAAAQFTVKF